ncbi:protein NKG7-like [Sorex fumeus]|uniref:protein NKG7-like n=1 Tax=Sorex fumeus TaxID=62283 RepID=UPI0024ACE3BC|nr:protein NKG7-like [Sorex fumeus]
MEPCRSLALFVGFLSLATVLVALSTDFWFEVVTPRFRGHSGLWSKNLRDSVRDYIRVTQSFSILAVLWGLVAVVFLAMSCVPALSAPGRGPIVSCFMAFAAALSAVVAMTVYTCVWWNQPWPTHIQFFFSWSFYLGWVSVLLFLCTGGLSLGAHCRGPLPGYESM